MPYEHIKPLGSDWVNSCISSDTLKTEHLVSTFLSFIQDQSEETFNDIHDEWHDVIDSMFGASKEPRDYEQETFLLEHLFHVMDAFSPDNCVFGAQDGDGALFGFWEFDNE